MDTPDPYLKIAKMTIRVIDGELRLFSGAPLPRLPENTIGDLFVPAYRLGNQALARWIQDEGEVELLPADTIVFAPVSPQKVPAGLRDKCAPLPDSQISPKLRGQLFVAIALNEPLILRLRGEKRSKLYDCKCTILALNLEAESLNHAFALTTATFEPERISRGGNVFINFAVPFGKKYWALLDDVRKLYEDRLEERRHFALLYESLMAEAREKQKNVATSPTDSLMTDTARLQGYFESCLESLREAFWASRGHLRALLEVHAKISENDWNALKGVAVRYLSEPTPPPHVASAVLPRIAAILPALYKIVDKGESLESQTVATVTNWAWAFLAEFEQARYKPDEGVQMLVELERLSPKQRAAVLAFAKDLAEGKAHLPS